MSKTFLKNWKVYLVAALIFLFFRFLDHTTNHKDTEGQRIVNDAWRIILVTMLHFAFYEYAAPFVSKKRKSILYNILAALPVFFVFVMLYSWGMYAWRLLGIQLHVYTALAAFKSSEHAATEQFTFSLMTLIFFGIVRHIYHYIRLRQAAQQLRIEKQQAELNYLKSQTNPHFLFNTLNNIYALAKDKSDLAPESILRLSKILRFMLYETSGKYIAIEQELKIMNDYIELEKLRYDETLHINFNYNIDNPRQSIPPLLLIPLVENAFKHGVSETRGRPFIDIHLTVKKQQLSFVVKNSSETSYTEVTENIGLSNLRRQLELLYSEYQLSVKQEQGTFVATLTINLDSHA
jgi:sensor histidine kinase YesM